MLTHARMCFRLWSPYCFRYCLFLLFMFCVKCTEIFIHILKSPATLDVSLYITRNELLMDYKKRDHSVHISFEWLLKRLFTTFHFHFHFNSVDISFEKLTRTVKVELFSFLYFAMCFNIPSPSLITFTKKLKKKIGEKTLGKSSDFSSKK